jgi:hypothetical protein
MLLQTGPYADSLAPVCVRRHKGRTRRIKRDLRLLAPLFALAGESLLLAVTIAIVERTFVVSDAFDSFDADYGVATISISSTSNVSTAPPGILPGEPLSP